ncbi:MAG: universal stress protein [Spirochaetia bacterium]|nr:universal stress protein [Spirochaetia bacterium]
MFNTMIVATDVSSASKEVVDCLGALKFIGTEKALLTQCMSMGTAASMAYSYQGTTLKHSLEAEKESLEAQGFQVNTEVLTGSVHKKINKLADKNQADLIVVGSHQHSFAEDILLGDIATNLLIHSTRPTLLLRLQKGENEKGEECVEGACGFGDHILYPTDFSENADHAFQVLEFLVSKGIHRLTLLHVQNKEKIDPHLNHKLDEFNSIDTERLNKLKEHLNKVDSSLQIDTVLSYGNPSQEILTTVAEKGATFIVMGKQGRGYIEEILLGGVSEKVAHHSPVSVLLVPFWKTE